MMWFFRFFVVAAVGVLLDITLAWLLVRYVGLSLTPAAACGFITAAVANYFMHETWTFSRAGQAISLKRAWQYLTMQGLTLVIRLLLVGLLDHAIAIDNKELIVLGLSNMVTLGINFLIGVRLIFRH